MELEEIVKKIKVSGTTAYKIAEHTLLTEVGINKILNGTSLNPRKSTLKILEDYVTNYVDKTPNNTKQVVVNEDPAKYSITNKSGNVFKELSDGSYSIQVKVVPFSAYAKYVSEYSNTDAELFGEWENITFIVDKVGRGNYLGFRVNGDSMNGGNIDDTPDKAIVLSRELGRQHWKDGFKPTKHGWIIVTKDNILFKDILGINYEKGSILCHSRNTSPEYCDFEYPMNDVKQIFKVIKRTF